jgi:prepilin-type N-terminal cleavage/methylation domain-containing protein
MLKALIQRFLIARQKQTNVSGFTLIELLVSIIIASIIVGTLLGFLVNILERDRTEQAKSESQEETQSALNYIADDVTEAVYIYDSDGLYQTQTINGVTNNVFSQLPHNFNTGSGCNATNCTPVLVFWKVFRYDRNDTVKGGNSGTKNRAVRCLDEPIDIDTLPFPPALPTATNCSGGNKYTYSLVAYYLLKDSNVNWSSTSRIVRWEIKDGIKWACQDTSTAAQLPASGLCPTAATQKITVNAVDYAVQPDPGFRRFDLSGTGTLAQRMNRWRADTANYDINVNGFDELVDYVDDTPYDPAQDAFPLGNPPANARVFINITKNTSGAPTSSTTSNLTCDDPDKGVGSGLTASELASTTRTVFAQRIPPDFANTTANPRGLSSFYACVNASRISARVFIRNNALARLKDNIANRPVSDAVFDSFLPTSNVRVFGRGILSVDP